LRTRSLFSPPGRAELKAKRVLIVDDDGLFRRFLKDHLSSQQGLEVVGEAEDGRKALEQAEALNPDLVLMDSRMPKLNGFKASRLLLEKMPQIKVIILAVFDNPKDKQAAKECGACSYVQKLNILEELVPAIRTAFRSDVYRKIPIKEKIAERLTKLTGAPGSLNLQHPDPEKIERLLQASLESEHKFRSLVDKSLLGIYVTQNHILKFCNSRFAEMFNYPGPEPMIGLNIRKLVAPESWDTVDREVKLRESGQKELSHYEFKAVRRDGSAFAAEVLGSRIQYEGQPAVQGMMIDITERKRSERLRDCLFRISEASAASSSLDELFHSIHLIIAELMPVKNFYIALFDPNGQTISFPYFVDEFDAAPARKKPGKGLTEYVLRTGEPLLASPDVFDELERRGEVESIGTPSIDWLGVPLKIEGEVRGVLVVQSYSGGVRYSEADKAVLKFVSDQVAQAIGRKQVESALQDRERFLAGIFDSIQDGLSVLDLDFTILRVNQTVEEWYAHARPLAGKKCYQAYHLRKKVCDICPTRKTLLTSKPAFEVVPKVGPEGKAVGWLGLYSFPFVDQGSGRMKGVIEFVRDITEQKKAEEQIRLNEARLQSLYNISQYRPKDMRDLWDYALQEAISLTGSKVGWLGVYRADRQTLNVIAWSREVMTDSRIKDRPPEFPVDKGGIWVEAIRSGEPLVINDYKADDPRKKGYPPGHLKLDRLMAIPIFSEDRTVHLVVVANKEQDYEATDIRQLTLLMDAVLKITQRKEAEGALRESQEKYQALVENLNEAIFSTDLEGKLTYISPAIELFTHFHADELIGRPFAQYIHPDDLSGLRDRFQGVLAGNIKSYEYRLIDKDGGIIHVRSHSRPLYQDGRPVGITGLLEDISERRKAEEALRESEERYRMLVENSLMGIGFSRGNQVIFANPALLRIFRYDALEEFAKIPLLDHVAPVSRKFILGRMEKVARGEPVPEAFEYDIICKDGQTRTLNATSSHFTMGGKTYTQSTFQDVTERQKAEEALNKSEKLFRTLIEHSQDAITMIAADGTVLYDSPSLLQILGYAPTERLGRKVFEFAHPDDRSQMRLGFAQFVLQPGATMSYQGRFRHKDGTLRWIEEVRANLLHEPLVQAIVVNYRDVTERKRSEEALRESEERFRSLFENSTIGIYRTTSDGRILLANPALVRMLGYLSFEELERRNLEKEGFVPEFPRSRFHLLIEKEGEVRGLESAWTKAGGTVIYVRESAKAIRDAGGKILYYEGTVEDITERRQAEEAFRHSEEQYRTLVESLNEVMISLDLEGKLDYVSPSVERISKYKVSELMGQPFAQFIHPDDLPDLMHRFSEALKGETRPYVFRILDKDGEVKFIRTHSRPIMKEGKAVGLTGLLEDFTKRKLAEEALRKSEERFKMLFTFAPDAFYLSDLQGRIMDCNNAAEVLWGYGKEELIGKNFKDLNLLSPSDLSRAVGVIEISAQNLPTGPDELVLTGKDGRKIHLEIRTFPLKIGGEVQILGVLRDITDRKTMESEAAHRMAELEEFYRMAVNRELRMIELKNEIEKLEARLAKFNGGRETRA
jgi:PAS domain S-box-containing protein